MIRNLVKTFKIYRFNPEINSKPYYQKFSVDMSKILTYGIRYTYKNQN